MRGSEPQPPAMLPDEGAATVAAKLNRALPVCLDSMNRRNVPAADAAHEVELRVERPPQ